jgi:hypothetical protein
MAHSSTQLVRRHVRSWRKRTLHPRQSPSNLSLYTIYPHIDRRTRRERTRRLAALPLAGGRSDPRIARMGGGRHLVITEGEIDALSVSQAFDNRWPVGPGDITDDNDLPG